MYSWNNLGDHKPYGEFTTSLQDIIENNTTSFTLNKIDSNESVGDDTGFFLDHLKVEHRPSFYDFMHSGWEINSTVALDFTASNGPVQYADSLHYMDPTGRPNQYQSALTNIGSILENYDTDKKIPAFGFGGIPLYSQILVQSKQASHCFHLNGQENPEVNGMQGLVEAYNFSLGNVKLYGPTHFQPCLQAFVNYVSENAQKKLYHIMLIITDGEIHDMDATKDLIVGACHLPISIIIVGVGDEDFEQMIELDGDSKVLKDSKGNTAIRDIVQFVRYKDFEGSSISSLTEEVLREVPEQVTSYFVINEIAL